jgi:addiction module RelE/StbE family toxin
MAAQKKEREVIFRPKPGFKERYEAFLKEDPSIEDSMKEFRDRKAEIPPGRLPEKMKDHKLDGKLKGIKECHLAADILLVYTHENDAVDLLDVCRHSGLKGKKGKALSKRVKNQ